MPERAGFQCDAATAGARGRQGPVAGRPCSRCLKAPASWPAASNTRLDHLEGKVFVDRLRGLQKDLIVRKIKKLSRSGTMVTSPRSEAWRPLPRSAANGRSAAHRVSSAPRNLLFRPCRKLLASRHRVCGVVTQPDRPRGRGRSTCPNSPVKAIALERGLPLLQPERLREPSFAATLREWNPDLGVVAAYGKLIPGRDSCHCLDLGMINVHASLLPKYRGAAPVQRAVIDGERETGVTIMRLENNARCRRDVRQGYRAPDRAG